MSHLIIASLLILTGICVYASINHAVIAFQGEFSSVHFLFALFCAMLVGFELTHLLTYTSRTIPEYSAYLKWEISFILLMFLFYPWFISEYTGVRPLWLIVGLNILVVVMFIENIFRTYSLQYDEITQLKSIGLPWGETLTHAIGRNGENYYVGVTAVIICFIYSIYALALRFYRDRMWTTLAILMGMGIFVLTGSEGMLVRMSVIHFIHLGPFGILAMIIAMSMALSQEMQQKLRASENRFRSLIEQSPFSIQVLSANGLTKQVNSAWEMLWGMNEKDILHYNPLDDKLLKEKGVTPYIQQGFAGNSSEIPPINYNPAENIRYQGPRSDRWVRAFVYPIKDYYGAVQEVVLLHEDVTEKKHFDDAIRLIATGVTETGDKFFQQIVSKLSDICGTQYAFIGLLDKPESVEMKTIAVYANGKPASNIVYKLQGTPCEHVVGKRTCVYPTNVQQLFPDDSLLVEMGVDGYIGTPLFDAEGNPSGIIVLLDSHPLIQTENMKAIMEIVAARVAAEIERRKADALLHQRQRYLQEMVDNRTSELRAAIDELEAFSYSVSHDLRAPLRSIDGFSQALVEDYGKEFDATGKDYLSRIRVNAQRMAELIDDLLQFSRINRKDIIQQPVNLSDLVTESCRKYQEHDQNRNVGINISPEVVVNGDHDLLAIVMDNLVSNAWKYTNKTENAQIEFGSRMLDGKEVCFIRDNGIGFEMKNAEKIFNPFQRLHSADEFEGTGIGLATVARIIKRHNGKIWAESKPMAGTTFQFILP